MEIVEKAAKIINKKYGINKVDVVIVLGSGLAKSAPDLQNAVTIQYKELGLPKSKVKGHLANFVIGNYNGKVVALASRMHYYESGDIKRVRLPLEIMAFLGAKEVVLLTSSGGLNKTYKPGDIMLIQDHINMSGVNPLVGINEIKFTDMGDCYNVALRKHALDIAKQNNLELKQGIFCQMSGPSYETKAEVNMLRTIGGDAVSMSTAHDCIIARYLNMEVVGFSVIVNVFTEQKQELTHEEVLENASKACQKLKTILSKIIK